MAVGLRSGREGAPLLCIGLDGGDLPFIERRRSHLPVLDGLLSRGTAVRADGYRALNGCSWHCFTTARPPREHGLYQHLNWDPPRMGMRLVSPDWYTMPPFWRALEERDGLRVTVVDVPYTMPGHLSQGLEVMDWGTHGQTLRTQASRAEGRAVLSRHGRSPIGRETPIPKTAAKLEAARQRIVDAAAAKTDLLIDLMDCRPWDLFIGVYAETHRGGHMLYGPGDAEGANDPETPLLSVYRAIDAGIGRLVEAARRHGATVMVFSAHGMARDRAQPGLVAQVMPRLNRAFLAGHCGVADARDEGGGLVRRLRRVVPAGVQLAIAEAVPDRVRAWVVEQEIKGGLDWAETPGFALRTDIGSDIRLNIRGRERDGFLERGSASHLAYCAMLEEVFAGLEDAETGATLVEELVPTGERFVGDRSTAIPDYIIVWRDVPHARRVLSPRLGEFRLPAQGPRGGDHTVDAFALVDRPSLPEGLHRPARVDELNRLVEGLLRAPVNA